MANTHEYPLLSDFQNDQLPVHGHGGFRAQLHEEAGLGVGRLYRSLPPEIDSVRAPEPDVYDPEPSRATDSQFIRRSDIARRRRAAFHAAQGVDEDILAELALAEFGMRIERFYAEVKAGRAWLPNSGKLDFTTPQPQTDPDATRFLYYPDETSGKYVTDSTPHGKTQYLPGLHTYAKDWRSRQIGG